MKAKSRQKDLTLIQLFDRFGTDEKARKHLESVLWPKGIVCPHCQCNEQDKFSSIAANPDSKVRAGLRWCANCQKQFTVTIGTIFEDSHIPLRKWLIAWYLLCSSKKGISSLQLQRLLELGSYRSALFMSHRIRHAIKTDVYSGKLTGTIEADETVIPTGTNPPEAKTATKFTKVMALVQRGGEARTAVVSGSNLVQMIRQNVMQKAAVQTDSATQYKALRGYFPDYKTVRHCDGEFKRKEYGYVVSTCSVESFFSLLKRGIIGTFHHVSEQHLPLYLAEFEHRHNCRKMSDGQRTDLGLTKAVGKRLMLHPPKA